MENPGLYSFGEFTLDERRRALRRCNRPVEIGGRGFDVLLALLRRRGELASKADLLAEVWPGQHVEENNLASQIASIRRALGEDGSRRFIATIAGRGYRFVETVQVLRPPEPPAPHNLPAESTSFIGRAAELAELAERLQARPMVTLVGPGGVGKTRLALHAASGLLARFPDGVRLVELAPVRDPAQVAEAACRALGVPAATGSDAVDALAGLLRQRRLLLILDCCEHVLEGACTLAAAIGRLCPYLRILATSRTPLRVAGEAVQVVAPLAVTRLLSPSAAEALRSEAVQLFADRAAAACPGFTLTDAEAPAVASICRRLDGLPLATELAAAQLRSLKLPGIAVELESRLLGPGDPGPDHPLTLRATIDWSASLLSEAEQRLLRRLSVFAGGCTLEAAEAVCGEGFEPGAIVDGIAGLVDRSLLLADLSGAATRYRMLETTRHYATDKLNEAGEAGWRGRFAEYMLGLFAAAEESWPTAPTAAWLGTYGPEAANLRAAIEWAFDSGAAGLAAALLARSIAMAAEGLLQPDLQRWIALAMARLDAATPAARASIAYLHARLKPLAAPGLAAAWEHAIGLARAAGDRLPLSRALRQAAIASAAPDRGASEALAMLEEAASLLPPMPAGKDRAATLAHAGSVHFLAGDQLRARQLNEEALAMRRALGDRSGVLASYLNLAELCFAEGDPAAALRFASAADAEARAAPGLGAHAHILGNLAGYRLALGDVPAARSAALEALELNRALREEGFARICLEHLALAALLDGDAPGAARLAGHVEAEYRRAGHMRERLEQAGQARLMAGLRAALGDATLRALMQEGAGLARDAAEALARTPAAALL